MQGEGLRVLMLLQFLRQCGSVCRKGSYCALQGIRHVETDRKKKACPCQTHDFAEWLSERRRRLCSLS